MIRCPRCSTGIPDSSRFCLACGQAIDPSSALPTQAAAGRAPGGTAVSPGAPVAPIPAPPGSPSPLRAARDRFPSSDAVDHGRFVPGTLIAGRYRIVELRGRGGMGEVHRADDLKIGQPVALKFLPEAIERDPARLARFIGEVRLARQVAHPNVCRVYDIAEADGRHFLSMEYVDGENLASLLRRIGRFPEDRAAQIARQVCAGLAAVHDRGILHRDLKPGNVMIDGRGRARITDFGLAGIEGAVRGEDVRAGTPAYMAPEQIAGREVTVRSDIYALGLVLYELFTGKHAFDGSPPSDRPGPRRDSRPTNPSAHIENLDPAVERAILRCLEKEPADRPASALGVAAALPGGDPLAAALAAGETPSPEIVAAAGDPGVIRPRTALACLGACTLGLLVGVALQQRSTVLGFVNPEKSPEVLADRAREILHRLGYTERPADRAHGLAYNEAAIDRIERTDPSPDRWDRPGPARDAAIYFWYRESPAPFLPSGPAGRVTPGDPAQVAPGSISLRLSHSGRLTSLDVVVPPAVAVAASGGPTADPASPAPAGGEGPGTPAGPERPRVWALLFEAAGLDPNDYRAAESSGGAFAAGDLHASWLRNGPGNEAGPVGVVASAFRGRPVHWRFVGAEEPAISSGTEAMARMYVTILFILVYAAAAFLAARNLRLRRGDRRGAFLLASTVFVLRLVWWACGANHVASITEEWLLLERAISRSLYTAGVSWLLYLALEPHVRRRWPQLLISWSRLLAGRWRDPLVGRDVLIGAAMSAPILAFGLLYPHALKALGESPPSPYPLPLDGLAGAGPFVATLLSAATQTLFGTMFVLMLLLILQVILRRRWLAIGAFFSAFVPVTLVAFAGRLDVFALLLAMVSSGIITLVLARFGLIATFVCVTFVTFLIRIPLTTDLSAWYAGQSIATLIVLAGLALYGFRVSLGGRPLVGEGLLRG